MDFFPFSRLSLVIATGAILAICCLRHHPMVNGFSTNPSPQQSAAATAAAIRIRTAHNGRSSSSTLALYVDLDSGSSGGGGGDGASFAPLPGGTRNSLLGKSRSADTTQIGDLVVPSVGVGTISWSSDKCKLTSPCLRHSLVGCAITKTIEWESASSLSLSLFDKKNDISTNVAFV